MLATAQDTDLDRGTTSVAPGMARHCALTREIKPVGELIRFVVGPDGAVVPDVKRKLPGRGLWLTGTRAVLEEAIRRNVFARGFRRQVMLAPALVADTERLLERSALDALAIAGKAGHVVTGATRIETSLRDDGVVALIHAADAASDGKRKLDAALCRKKGEKSRETAIVETFTGEQLDLALNRPNVVHAALLAGPVSETFLARVRRLERFRTGNQARPGEAHMRRRTAHEE
jgi:predicted RNA-binding protein YlxR (DUF448 family)